VELSGLVHFFSLTQFVFLNRRYLFVACELFSKLASMFGVIEFDAFGFGGYDIYLLW